MKTLRQVAAACAVATLTCLPIRYAQGEPITRITIDGSFSDWDGVPSYFDAHGTAGGTVFHEGTTIPDVHDTDHNSPADIPVAVNHPDVDLLEFKFTHDENALYAYFHAAGQIGRTQVDPPGDDDDDGGRYYAIVTIDVDNNDSTGYWLNEGGYFPTSDGYDMNMEAEFYNGELNTAHYLSHDALDSLGLYLDFMDLTSGDYDRNFDGPYNNPGFVQPASGNYDEYTQWVYHQNDTLTLVEDRGPVIEGIMSVELSPDGTMMEMRAPFKGFMPDSLGNPNMALGKTIDISFSLEASGELATGGWASDTGDPIIGYYLDPTGAVDPTVPEPSTLLLVGLAGLLAMPIRRQRAA